MDFDARPLVADPHGKYGALDLSWSSPVGAWSLLRLVRNSYGVPVSFDDGVVLLESNSGPAATGTVTGSIRTYADVGLEPGSFQYYAIWLYIPGVGEWTRAASCIGLPVKDHGYTNRLWELTPPILRTQTPGLLDSDNETLRSFLALFGFQLDYTRSDLETLRFINDPQRVSGNLLPLMAQQLGQFFEPELGMKQMRALLRNTVYLYRNKGTTPGVEGFVSAISGYGAKLQPFKNLVLDYNTSSAEESIGQWKPGEINSSLSRYVADGVIDAPSALGTMRRVGIFKQTAFASGLARVRTAIRNYETDGHLTAVPVTGGAQYTFSGYARAAAAGPTAAGLDIFWMGADGLYISGSGGAGVTPTMDWAARPFVTATAPATAVYAAIGMHFTAAAANESVYWDGFQFEPGGVVTDFEDSRLLDINVLAPRVNHFKNPMPASTAHFNTQGGVGSFTGGKYRSVSDGTGGASADGVTRVQLSSTPLGANLTVTVSMYVTLSQAHTVNVQEMWAYSMGPAVQVPANTRTRVSGTFTTLAGGVGTGISFQLQVPGAVSTETIDVDRVLVEQGAALNPYFDGSTHAFVGDSLWEGAADLSRSHYYPQRRTKNYRMAALLPEYTPMGSSFRLNYALPL